MTISVTLANAALPSLGPTLDALKALTAGAGWLYNDGSNVLAYSTPPLSRKLITTTRDTSAVDGNQVITGAGFRPTIALIHIGVGGTEELAMGFYDGTTMLTTVDYVGAPGTGFDLETRLVLYQSAGIYTLCTGVSLDADGLTLNWAKTGAKTGTATLNILVFK